MSFNLLKFGINVKTPKNIDKPSTNEKHKGDKIVFPNCTKKKRIILLIKRKIKNLKQSADLEKLKEKKLTILLDKLATARQALMEKLNIITQDEIDPLCSFEEIQKYNYITLGLVNLKRTLSVYSQIDIDLVFLHPYSHASFLFYKIIII
jgi:hypothetical protein